MVHSASMSQNEPEGETSHSDSKQNILLRTKFNTFSVSAMRDLKHHPDPEPGQSDHPQHPVRRASSLGIPGEQAHQAHTRYARTTSEDFIQSSFSDNPPRAVRRGNHSLTSAEALRLSEAKSKERKYVVNKSPTSDFLLLVLMTSL